MGIQMSRTLVQYTIFWGNLHELLEGRRKECCAQCQEPRACVLLAIGMEAGGGMIDAETAPSS